MTGKCQCGKYVAPEFEFCPGCGSRFTAHKPAKPAWQQSVEKVEAARSGSQQKPDVFGTLVGLILIGLMAWGMYSCSGISGDTSAETSSKGPDAIDAGYALCSTAQTTGLTTGCEVQGWGKTIDLRVDTTSAEARKLCTGIASQMSGRGFAGQGWRLQVFSPYSGDQPIATCNLH